MSELQLIDDRQQQPSGLRELLAIVFKHKVKIVTVFFAVSLVVTIGAFVIPPAYEAESSLMVKIGREYLSRSEIGSSDKMPPVMSLSQEEIANSEIQILTSRDSIEKVISALKLENVYPKLREETSPKSSPMDSAIALFSKNLSAEAIRRSNVIKVTFRHEDPRIAATAVDMLVEQFKEKHLQVFSDPKSSFLDKQRADYEQKLKDSGKELQNFKQKSGVFALEEQRTLLLKQRVDLDSALKTSEHTIQELIKRILSLKGQIKNITENKIYYTQSERDQILTESKKKLLELQLAEQELLKKYTEDNRLVKQMRKEIQIVSEFVNTQEADIHTKVKTGNPVYQDAEMQLIKAETELNAQKGKSNALKLQVAQVDSQIRALDASETMSQQLSREYVMNEKNYQAYVEKAEEARISDDMNRQKMANISVIHKASVPAEPVRSRGTIVGIGVLLALASAFAVAFLSESTSQRFSSPEKLEQRLGIPVLATISLKEG